MWAGALPGSLVHATGEKRTCTGSPHRREQLPPVPATPVSASHGRAAYRRSSQLHSSIPSEPFQRRRENAGGDGRRPQDADREHSGWRELPGLPGRIFRHGRNEREHLPSLLPARSPTVALPDVGLFSRTRTATLGWSGVLDLPGLPVLLMVAFQIISPRRRRD